MLKSLVSIVARLPLRVHYWCADYLLYPLIMYVVRYRRSIVEKNLRLSFPDKSEAERRQITRDFYHQFCDTIVETIYGFRHSNADLREKVVFGNWEAVDRAAQETGGAIVMMAHLGNWEWLATLQEWLSPGVTEVNIYRKMKSPAMDDLILAIRGQRGGVCVEKQRVLREFVRFRAAKQPIVVGLISDQKPRPEVTRTWMEFLNQETGFLDGGEVLGEKFGYPVFYACITRPRRGHYRCDFQVLSATPKDTREGEITTAFARALEKNIQAQPALWLWTHNRWKWKRMKG